MTIPSSPPKILALAGLMLLGLGVANAQTTRADVKADAVATKASQPMGEMSVPNQDKGMKRLPHTKARAEVKAEARTAERAGRIPQGEQSTASQGKKPIHRTASTTTRAEVKADAKAANKAGDIPVGQSSVKNQDKGGAPAVKN
jgi:hypothetical protein